MTIFKEFARIIESIKVKKLQLTITGATEWDDIKLLVPSLSHWYFRGQARSCWTLSSSFERIASQFHCEPEYYTDRETWMLWQFQRRSRQYIEPVPTATQRVDWLALMQQYGAPTRLLDFTHSFYVGAFFALESADSESALWALNPHLFETIGRNLTGDSDPIGSQRHITWRHLKIAEEALSRQEVHRLAISVEPNNLPERLSVQQGMFLMPCEIEATFWENLVGGIRDFYGNQNFAFIEDRQDLKAIMETVGFGFNEFAIVKIVMPSSVQYRGLSDLEKMNITAASLFPGLDGFAKSLKIELRLGQIQKDYERDQSRIQKDHDQKMADLERQHGIGPESSA